MRRRRVYAKARVREKVHVRYALIIVHDHGGAELKEMKEKDNRAAADTRLDFREEEAADKSQNTENEQDEQVRKDEQEKQAEQDGQDEVKEDPVVCLEQLEREKEELYQNLLRLRADFDNYRRRTREELQLARGQALEEFVLGILPVLDNLERAVDCARVRGSGEEANLLTGVEMVFRQFMAILEKEGVTPITAVGELFDPEKHEAFCRDESEQPENTILEELQKGYLFGKKTIRPSLVKVAAGRQETVAGETEGEGTKAGAGE